MSPRIGVMAANAPSPVSPLSGMSRPGLWHGMSYKQVVFGSSVRPIVCIVCIVLSMGGRGGRVLCIVCIVYIVCIVGMGSENRLRRCNN